ncbi:MAG TPA: hypothetical protein VF427_07285 [Noviherbaspirillum sp.]
MNDQLIVLLGCAFVGAFLMTLLRTGRWKAVLVCVIVVWCARLGQTEIDLIAAGRTESYLWFAFLALAAWIPAAAVSLIGVDIGMAVRKALFPNDDKESEEVPSDASEEAGKSSE